MASIRKLPSGHYQVRWRDLAGRWKGKTAPNKREAARIKAEVEVQLSRGNAPDPRRGRRSFGAYLEEVIATIDVGDATRALYETEANLYIRPALGGRGVAQIGPEELRHLYIGLREEGVGIPTIQIVHRVISRVLAQAVLDGLIAANPARLVKKPRHKRAPIRVLTVDEVFRLAVSFGGLPGIDEALKDGTVEQRLATFSQYRSGRLGGSVALVMAFAGLRLQEALALRVSSVHDGRIDVTEAISEVRGHIEVKEPKTGRPRTVPILPELEKVLQTSRPVGAPLFPNSDGGWASPNRYRARPWREAVEIAKLTPAPTPHDLRHTYAAMLIRTGAHPKVLQERLGHSSIRVTLDTYGHLFPNISDDVAALGALS